VNLPLPRQCGGLGASEITLMGPRSPHSRSERHGAHAPLLATAHRGYHIQSSGTRDIDGGVATVICKLVVAMYLCINTAWNLVSFGVKEELPDCNLQLLSLYTRGIGHRMS
jgi:hypothetical protein